MNLQKIVSLLTWWCALVFSTPSSAQIDVGAGGDVIRCQPSSVNALNGYYSLDYLLTLEERSNPLSDTKDAKANLERIARILQDKIPHLGDSLLKFTQLIENTDSTRARLWREANFGLVDLKDEYLVDTLPDNCKVDGKVKVVQAAIRLTPIAAGVVDRTVTYRYVPEIFRDLEKNAALQLSFLLLHEWLWDISADVRANRNINRFLHTEELSELEPHEVVAKLKTFGVQDRILSENSPVSNLEPIKIETKSKNDRLIEKLDELHALWSHYKYAFIRDGRVVSLDENEITTSEGQGYGMLRAVWSGDRETFDRVWRWTQQNLQIRDDSLFAWRWKGKVLDRNSASDADIDIALALSIAATRFGDQKYLEQAQKILADIWRLEVVATEPSKTIKKSYYLVAGDWAKKEKFHKIHIGYLAPYAYSEFARIDSQHPWERLIESSYDVLNWLYVEKSFELPPEFIWLDAKNNKLLLKHPRSGQTADFGYDVFPIFWRLAADISWRGLGKQNGEIGSRALAFFQREWRETSKFMDRYSVNGKSLSNLEGLPLYATVESLARQLATSESLRLAEGIDEGKLKPLFERALLGNQGGKGIQTPYYLHNWLWFGRALNLEQIRTHAEFLYFLRPFNWKGFQDSFPWIASAILLALYPFSLRFRNARLALLFVGYGICLRYLYFRFTFTLNLETWSGMVVSSLLLLAECYSFISVVLLNVQVGLSGGKSRHDPTITVPGAGTTTVDIFIPIYSEPLEILEMTLIGVANIEYDSKKIYVCDDSHRLEVKDLAESYGATYILGPKRHAKAGNINNALAKTDGALVVIFDTDHIPVKTFLQETVPYFDDQKMGIVQTPHVFYNDDIFQRSLGRKKYLPSEQDMFNQAIQAGRDSWGGSFFVGSGAVFRRTAIEAVGGIQLLSITEDIHTSQKIHAAGWKSAFVAKNLAVGLSAENIASHLVQRRRWMLGCLQILQKDNPLFERGLSWRQRLGYFASLYYFLFPLVRVIYWLTPLWFLFFHLYPILADVSVLLGYMLPSLAALVLMTQSLIPGWPRLFWNSIYESAISFPLARSMLDLFLPKRLGFKVTPKGLISEKRRFDHATVKLTLVCALINLIAVLKGLGEFFYFGIEQDAYFFNLAWGIINLGLIGIGLLVAWERPQRRSSERIAGTWPVHVANAEDAKIIDISISGVRLKYASAVNIPDETSFTFQSVPDLVFNLRKVYQRKNIVSYSFSSQNLQQRQALVRIMFSDPETWKNRHERRTTNTFVSLWVLMRGVIFAFRPLQIGVLAAAISCSMPVSQLAEASPTETWYLFNARTNLKIGNTKAAIEAFEKLVAIDPSHKEAQRSLGLAYEKQGMTDKAVAQFDRYLKRFTDSDPEIEFKLANYLLAPRYEYRQADAIKLFRRGLNGESRYAERRKLAQLLAKKASTVSDAIEQFEILVAERPDDQDMRAEYRKALLWTPNNRDKAIKEYETYVVDHPKDAVARRQLGLLLVEKSGRQSDAEEILQDICKKNPKDRQVCLAYVRLIAKDANKRNTAIAQYKSLMAQEREYTVELESADLLAKNEKDSVQAADAYASMISRRPNDASLRLKYAQVLARHESSARQASIEFEKALKLAPKDPSIARDSHVGLARTYAWLGEKDLAVYHSEKAKELPALPEEKESEMNLLSAAMMQGREPRNSAVFHGFAGNDVRYGALELEHARPLNAFMDGAASVGFEALADIDRQRMGTTGSIRFDARWRNEFSLFLAPSIHSISSSNNRLAYTVGVLGNFDLESGTDLELSVSLISARRLDSITSVVGYTDSFGFIGGVIDNRATIQLKAALSDWDGLMRVEFGKLKSRSDEATKSKSNGTNRLVLGGSHSFFAVDLWSFLLAGEMSSETYERECGVKKRTIATQCADGYFSPKFFFTSTLKPQIKYEAKESIFAVLGAGPKYDSEEIDIEIGKEEESHRLDSFGWSSNLSLQIQTKTGWKYFVEASYHLTNRSRRENLSPVNIYGSTRLSAAKIL